MGILDKMLHDEEEGFSPKKIEIEPVKHIPVTKRLDFWIAFLIFIAALALRLYSLFNITNPQNSGVEGWYSDTYHHWQIAYLSNQIGFNEGFLRLWDLKGLEYFWGLMHPLIGSLLISITGSADIVIFRV